MSRAAYTRNRAIESFLRQKTEKGVDYSMEDLAYINQYTGYGGLANYGATGKGLLSEYFTPIPIVEKMVGLAIKHGYQSGPVLEPSCGIGRFLHYFSPDTEVTAYEINPTSYQIAKLNFPHFTIQQQYFNEVFVARNGQAKAWKSVYQLVIGNPPYGDFIGKYSTKERARTKATRYEEYFLTRSLDLLLPSGLLVFILPSSFLDTGSSPLKQAILAKAQLLEAYRLPKGIFRQTDIGTDILIFQKNKAKS